MAQLKQRLGEAGIAWEQRSQAEYRLTLDGELVPATYAFLGVPPTCTDAEAHELLSRAVSELSLRLVWMKLAAAAGDSAAAAEQQARADAWGIE